MVSVIIPVHNDEALLVEVINNLLSTAHTNKFQIVVVNDGSVNNVGRFVPFNLDIPFCHIKTVDIPRQKGVGYAFDRGVEAADGDIIVLMGADVFTDDNWLNNVIDAVATFPNDIGCSACVGLSPETRDMKRPERRVRYGADVLLQMGFDDLPPYRQKELSTRSHKADTYTHLFRAKWRWKRDNKKPYVIPCLLGAFYFTTKDFYNLIHGWDTERGELYMGHRLWGALEPMISLKTWLYGGTCYVHPSIETGHVFGRILKKTKYSNRAFKPSVLYWNELWIAYTMCDDKTRDYLVNWLKPTLNSNKGKTDIKRHMDNVSLVRKRNDNEFARDINWFMERFNIELK